MHLRGEINKRRGVRRGFSSLATDTVAPIRTKAATTARPVAVAPVVTKTVSPATTCPAARTDDCRSFEGAEGTPASHIQGPMPKKENINRSRVGKKV